METTKETITLVLDSKELKSFHQSNKQVGDELKLWAAVGLFRAGKVSVEKAASIAGIHRFDFENFLADNNIPISNMTAEDLENDIKLIRSGK